jgi:hypothetical protein
MDRYNSTKCKNLEEAIDALGIPSHVEVNDGVLSITLLGTIPVTLDLASSGARVLAPIPDWVTLD